MKILTTLVLILAVAMSALPAQVRKKKTKSKEVPVKVSALTQKSLDELVAERDSLWGVLEGLKTSMAPLDEYLNAGVAPLLECGADTLLITQTDTKRYAQALSAYEEIVPMLEYYNPYPDVDLPGIARGMRGRLDLAEKVAKAKVLLSSKNNEGLAKAAKESLLSILDGDELTDEDRVAVQVVHDNIDTDLYWGDIYRDAIQRLREWAVLPDAKMASSAYDKIIKPVIVDKIAQVYPGRETLPDEFVKLNDILARLTDATKNYSKSKYWSKVSSEPAFKAWLRQLADSL